MKEIQTLLEKDQTLNREAPMRESEDLQQIQQREHRKTNQLDEYFTDRKEMWKKLWSSFQKKPFGSFGCTVEREGATNRYQELGMASAKPHSGTNAEALRGMDGARGRTKGLPQSNGAE